MRLSPNLIHFNSMVLYYHVDLFACLFLMLTEVTTFEVQSLPIWVQYISYMGQDVSEDSEDGR